MTTKTKVIIAASGLLVAFAFGRYTASNVASVQTSIDKDISTDKHTNTDTKKTTTITEEPDGKKVTVITEDTKIESDRSTDTKIKTDQTVTMAKKSLINISALASVDVNNGFIPVYGISANKELLGPITVGAFGFTNGVVGLSLGINF